MTNQENTHPVKSFKPVIHRGPWVIAGFISNTGETRQEIIEDGALVVADGFIKAVGKYKNLTKEFGHYHTHDHEGSILAPALINGHCHLELSHLDLASIISGQKGYDGDPVPWIKNLLAAREKFSQDSAEADKLIRQHARKILHQMSAAGVAFVGDVGNSLASRNIGDNQGTRVYFLLELLGLTKESETKTFAWLKSITANTSLTVGCTAHAPYSTTPALIQAIKRMADHNGQIFSMHVAESNQEIEFLRSGTGPFRDFLIERGGWDNSFTIPGKGPVQYLETLGVLNDKTLCVHGVHVEEAEVEVLAKKGAKVCLCPGSNRFLGVGKAPVTEFLAHGILPALGTDSMASNPVLNMWHEMQLLREDHPGLSPATVFDMATRGGAEAWGVAPEMGSLTQGKLALTLAVKCHEKINSTKEVFEYLTTTGNSVQTEWLQQIRKC